MAWFPIPDKPDWEYSTDPNLDKKPIDHYDYDNDAVHDQGKKKTFAGEKFVLARQMFNQHPGYGEIYVKDPAIKALFATRTAIAYDPQDLTTMYQDAARTLPVYRPGAGLVDPPVGLMLDKGQGLELGPELWDGVLIPSSGDGVYNAETGELSCVSATGLSYRPSFSSPKLLKRNTFYWVRVSFSGNFSKILSCTLTPGSSTVSFINGSISQAELSAGDGAVEKIAGFIYHTGDSKFTIWTNGTTTWDGLFIESISIREIKGYHAYQPTPTARPTLSGKYNLLKNSLTGFVISGSVPLTITQTGITAPTGENAVTYTNTSGSASGNLMIFPGTPCPSTPLIYTIYIHNSSTRRVFSISVYNQTKNSSVLPARTFNLDTKAVSGEGLVANEMENGWYQLTLSIDDYSGITSGDLINTYITTGFAPGNTVVFGGADLRVKRDGSSLPAYQSVTSATVYDTAGFPLYLKRDRVDDDLIVQAPAIAGAWAHGTIDGPVIGTVAIPAGEYHPFGANPIRGLYDCTQWIAIDGTLSASEQAVFERYVYSKARQLIGVDQFGGSHYFGSIFHSRPDITTLDTSSWDTKNVSSMASMFDTTYTSILDVSGWDTSKVRSFGYFLYAPNITSIDVSGWDTGNVENLSSFIKGTKAPVIDVSNFNTSKIENCYSALDSNKELLEIDISGWDTSKVTGTPGGYTGFRGFVNNCVKLATVLVGNAFDNTPSTNFQNAFTSTNLNQASIDAILVSINTAGTSNGVFDQSGGSAPSATGEAAITAMRSRGWTVHVTGGFTGKPAFSFGLDSVASFSFTLQTKADTAPVTIDWGDGTQSTHAGTTDQTASHTYAVSGTYAVKVYGADDSVLTKFSADAAGMSGDLVMPAGMTHFTCAGANTLSGTLSLPSGMTHFRCVGSNTLSGPLQLPAGMTHFTCAGYNTLSGYTPSAKASNQQRFYLIGLNTMSAADVDNILIDYAAAGGTWAAPKEILIQGPAADRTSASDAAYASLATKLTTLDVD